jgi:hypothetical protein
MLAQAALAGDQVARGVMLQYWRIEQESTTGHGSPGFGSLSAANAQATPRHRDITRIQMPGIRIDTAEHAQNSLYMFEARCQQMDIPTAGGDAQQDQLLDQLVSKWCEQVSVVLTSLRCTFPVGGSGAEEAAAHQGSIHQPLGATARHRPGERGRSVQIRSAIRGHRARVPQQASGAPGSGRTPTSGSPRLAFLLDRPLPHARRPLAHVLLR